MFDVRIDGRLALTTQIESVAGYRYAPFGAVVQAVGACAAMNPFRFSSEYADDELGLVYYNYRHYNPRDGRWVNRDPIRNLHIINLYNFINNYHFHSDLLGRDVCSDARKALGASAASGGVYCKDGVKYGCGALELPKEFDNTKAGEIINACSQTHEEDHVSAKNSDGSDLYECKCSVGFSESSLKKGSPQKLLKEDETRTHVKHIDCLDDEKCEGDEQCIAQLALERNTKENMKDFWQNMQER